MKGAAYFPNVGNFKSLSFHARRKCRENMQ